MLPPAVLLATAFGLATTASAVERPLPKHAAGERHLTMGRVAPDDPTLIVTFADRPAADVALRRLGVVGAPRPLVPEIGIWAVQPTEPATARAALRAVPGVRDVEWSIEHHDAALPSRRPAIPALPQIAVADPSDPLYQSRQWSMHTGRWTPSLTGRTDRPPVAVLDSGLDTAHPEWSGADTVVAPWDAVRRKPTGTDGGLYGHGSHVAGILGAPANGVGIVGVAPVGVGTARLIPVKITFRSGGRDVSSSASSIAGIVHAVNHGAKVVNISSGGPGFSLAFQDTVNWAYRRGALVVASVGNEGEAENELNFPAGYDHVVGVAASCGSNVDGGTCPVAGGRAMFSNSNYSVDVLAPGVDIISTLPLRLTDPAAPAGYGYLSGTSMAAPYVAGTAALVAASHPGISPFQLLRVIESTADRAVAGTGRNSKLGWGKVNPALAVDATAPVDDLAEPNDDATWLPAKNDIVLGDATPRVALTAWADFNDDQTDVYALRLSAGQRVRVTIRSSRGRFRVFAYQGGGRVSPNVMTDAQFAERVVGATSRTTPGARTVAFRARRSGRHLIQVVAAAGTADTYRLTVGLLG